MIWGMKIPGLKNAGHGTVIYRILLEIILAILILSILVMQVPADVFAEENSETAYRIKPLQDKLAAMDSGDIDQAAALFSDMDKHWSRQVVGKLTGLEIVSGVKGKFLPNDPVQADQFVKMAIRAMGYKIEQGTGYWAQPYIDAAYTEGIIVKGEIKDYTKMITREQMARIIVRAVLKIESKPDSKYDQYIIGKVTDYHAVADGIKQFVLDAYKLGLITGNNNKFNPKGTLTRAEAAAVIIRFLDATERKPMAPTADEIIKLPDNDGNMVEYYPGAIREYFDVAKAMRDALPKAKGYAVYYRNVADGGVVTAFFRSEEEFKESPFNTIGGFDFSPEGKLYDLTVYDVYSYKTMFADYMREVLKTLYGKDAGKAIALHDKYLNMNYTRTDGLNECTSVKLNNRITEVYRYNQSEFAMHIWLPGAR